MSQLPPCSECGGDWYEVAYTVPVSVHLYSLAVDHDELDAAVHVWDDAAELTSGRVVTCHTCDAPVSPELRDQIIAHVESHGWPSWQFGA
jgi:hypothetical protein